MRDIWLRQSQYSVYLYVKLYSEWQREAQAVQWCTFKKSEPPENPQMDVFLSRGDFP